MTPPQANRVQAFETLKALNDEVAVMESSFTELAHRYGALRSVILHAQDTLPEGAAKRRRLEELARQGRGIIAEANRLSMRMAVLQEAGEEVSTHHHLPQA